MVAPALVAPAPVPAGLSIVVSRGWRGNGRLARGGYRLTHREMSAGPG